MNAVSVTSAIIIKRTFPIKQSSGTERVKNYCRIPFVNIFLLVCMPYLLMTGAQTVVVVQKIN